MEGYDTREVALNTRFEDVRVEEAGVFIKLALDEASGLARRRNRAPTSITSTSQCELGKSNRTSSSTAESGTSGHLSTASTSRSSPSRATPVHSQTTLMRAGNIANGVTTHHVPQ
jgi:hypothetical protein